MSSETGQRQFVTFECGGESFGVDLNQVQEIIRIPPTVRVPLSPAGLDGLANLRGQVLPVLSLRRLFGMAETEADDAGRVLVVEVGQPLGFTVDRVTRVVSAAAEQIEGAEEVKTAVDTELLNGLIKDSEGGSMTMLIDFNKLVDREFTEQFRSQTKHEAAQVAEASDEEAVLDEVPLVSFTVSGQEYAIAIEEVREIVPVPETLVRVPRAEPHVLGLMTLRNRLLPLVSLRRLFGLDERPLDDKSRIVVLEAEGQLVGLGVDGVSEVLRVPRGTVEPMPPLLARQGELADIEGLCRLDGGKRLVSVIQARPLFRLQPVKDALETSREEGPAGTEEEAVIDDEEQLVVFRLDAGEFGVPIEAVQEIVRVPDELVKVPKAPPAVEGVINLRGTVLPVVDLRTRLGIARLDRNDAQRIMVFLLGGVPTGFIVDQVAEVLKVPLSAIETSPRLSEAQGALLSRMANLARQSRMIQLLDPERLLEGEERKKVAAAGKSA